MSTKKLQILDGLNFVKYTEQTLTDEQRAQARANIAKYQYEWYTVKYSIFQNIVADYHIVMDGSSSIDCELASNTTSVKLSSASALGSLAFFAKMAFSGAVVNSSTLTTNIAAAVAEFEAIKAAGALTGNYLYLCYQLDNEEPDFAFVLSEEVEYENYTHSLQILVDNVNNSTGIIHWNNNTQEYENQVGRLHIDATLSMTGEYADAKATGDAINAVSALVGDTSVSEQISTAIQESVADWSQTDETAANYIKNKPNETDALELVAEMGLVTPVAASDGSIYTDENGDVYTL